MSFERVWGRDVKTRIHSILIWCMEGGGVAPRDVYITLTSRHPRDLQKQTPSGQGTSTVTMGQG